MEHMSHEDYVAKQRGRARVVARQVLAGEMSVLLGARLIAGLDGLETADGDEDLASLRLVNSETGHLPVGDERQYWAPAALERKAGDLTRAESWARDVALDAFRNLAERWPLTSD